MVWTLEVGQDPEAINHEVVDRHGNQVQKVRAALRVPLLGVYVERFVVNENGEIVLASDGQSAQTERCMIWFGTLQRSAEWPT